ncbi:hypothetical protein FHW74_000006 [Atlantibacter sp. RC6]|nr:hypothetical protein [Atlantibacter sp. RC6]
MFFNPHFFCKGILPGVTALNGVDKNEIWVTKRLNSTE